LLALCAVLSRVAVAAEPPETGQVVPTILALEDKWRVAQHRNDVAAFLALLSPDLTFIGTSGSLRNRSDYIASRDSSWIPRATTYEYSELRVRVFGPVAVVIGREATTGRELRFKVGLHTSGRRARVSGAWLRSNEPTSRPQVHLNDLQSVAA